MNKILISALKILKFDPEGTLLAKVLKLISFGFVRTFDVYQLQRRFNRQIDNAIQVLCDHASTYESHGWSGSSLWCKKCHKRLQVLSSARSEKKKGAL